MALSDDTIDASASAFFDGFCAGDFEAVESLLAPGFRAWHNTDDVWQDTAEHLATLRWLKREIEGLRYEGVERTLVPDGFVQTHVLTGTVRGEDLALRACVIGRFSSDGKLSETREYLDSRALRPLYSKG